MAGTEGIRINKFLSESGLCSRREADRMIESGRVTINGKQPSIGQRVRSKDAIRVDGREVENNQEDAVYLLLNKPVGIVTTTDTKGEVDNIIDYVNYPSRIFPVGRLDKDSEGLIILTSDGDIVNKILRAGNQHEKEYEVTVDRTIDAEFVKAMANGIPIMGSMTKKCKVEQIAAFTFRITLTQGMNRQIRRMCEFLNYEVRKLKRTRIMHLSLDVPNGQWRPLTQEELETLHRALAKSEKTAPKKARTSQSSAQHRTNKKKNPSKASGHGAKQHVAPKGSGRSKNSRNKKSTGRKR